MLTPAFCQDNIKRLFFPIFKEKANILINNLNKEVGNTQPFNMFEYISDAVFSSLTRNYIIFLNSNNQTHILYPIYFFYIETTIGFNLDVVSKQGSDLKQSVLKYLLH